MAEMTSRPFWRAARKPPALVESAAVVGSVQIRNRATLAGNICNASPAADTAPALLAYGATVNLFVNRHGDYFGYGPEAAELVGIPEPETFMQLPWDKRVARLWCTLFRNREERDEPPEDPSERGARAVGHVAHIDVDRRPHVDRRPQVRIAHRVQLSGPIEPGPERDAPPLGIARGS